ncbi:ACT domain-containing protein [Hymenobacter sp. 15J16-1T3B]|uniref:ACT domain-containing protein n=1 Tax=Hymenobacter sp. 15J16-1T3B TaxID=2886941 RepID=UPI001D0FB41E|nr:ACT domain-containing protein [Hymenobacter sp. 15J16-1T3B]MCC3156368.1 ACT domain-containing protein [Hymenobacter sp. 15J16-1T3B]
MTGETDLPTLLRTMTPVLHPGAYVFCSLPEPLSLPAAELIGLFREPEGVTVIVRRELADRLQLPYSFVAAWLTLQVHSALTAVGLTAAVAQALTAQRISCNVVAAYYHDHLFVDHADGARALAALQDLARTS